MSASNHVPEAVAGGVDFSPPKIAMGKGTYERSIRHRSDFAKATSPTSVKEQMTKWDADIALAMESLEAAAQGIALSIAEFAESSSPGATALRLPAVSWRNRSFPKEFGLAADIDRVVYRLKLLQAAVDKATRRQRRRPVATARKPAA
ncbi:hypothetical protein [Variovorax paradoxus]|uniref:hypothetical protein n=1 Tax=Variovorax paradoxus TaxID=34073 RepID=UPI002481579C|nr:hypothetical protein [Variovorax paradoxus]WGT63724.1 hypothetical protein QHG62_27470 [Variovorax paradoxus]